MQVEYEIVGGDVIDNWVLRRSQIQRSVFVVKLGTLITEKRGINVAKRRKSGEGKDRKVNVTVV
jgi:hypothetical protein